MATKQGFVDIMTTLLENQVAFLQHAIKAFKEVASGGESTSEIGQAYLAANKTSKKLKKKLAADPNKPKRSPSGYHLFMSVHSSSLKEENPGKNQTEILTIVAKKWHDSTVEEKNVYMKQAAVLKDEFELKLEEYNRSLKSSSIDSQSASPTTSSEALNMHTSEASEELLLLKKRSSLQMLTAGTGTEDGTEDDKNKKPTKKQKAK
jgi:hypothetical protein